MTSFVVMWSFKIVLCSKDCDLKLCKSLKDYINNIDECRGTAAVYRSTTIGLSLIPLTGFGNFYSGNKFDGAFKIAEGIIALLSICCCCAYVNGSPHNDDDLILACELFWSVLLMAVNIVRYAMCIASTNSFDSYNYAYEFCLMMTTMAISLIFGCCGCASRRKRPWIVSAILNVIVVILMETIRDVYMAANYENDWNGCPFI